MNCDAIIEDLQAFLDDELQSNRRGEIELHLKACKECSQMIGDLGDLSNLLRSCDVPTPNLPTGRQILTKAGFELSEKSSLGFFQSVYNFLFKYKAPVIATVSALAIFGVYINLSGTNPYSQAPSVSSQYKTQETTASNSLAKSAPEASKEQIAANMDTPFNKYKEANAIVPSESQASPAASSAPSQSFRTNGDVVSVEGGVAGGVEGGVVGGVVGESASHNFVSPEPPASQPPSPPADTAALAKKSVAETEGKTQTRDELERAESGGRAITLEKDTRAKKEAPKLEDSKLSSSSAVAEEVAADKSKNARSDTYKETPKTEAIKPLESVSGGKGKDSDPSSSAESAIAPKAKAPAKADVPRPGVFSQSKPSAGASIAQMPVNVPAREVEEKKAFVKSALIVIEAKELAQAKEQISEIAKENVGSFTSSQKEQSINFTIRVPLIKFESTLAELRKLGKVTRENTNDDDNTDAEKQREDSRKAESKDTNKKSDDQGQTDAKRRQKENVASFAVINVVLQQKTSK